MSMVSSERVCAQPYFSLVSINRDRLAVPDSPGRACLPLRRRAGRTPARRSRVREHSAAFDDQPLDSEKRPEPSLDRFVWLPIRRLADQPDSSTPDRTAARP